MIALKTILFPTDFSDTSEVALRYARTFAQKFNASLHVLHILEDPLINPAAKEWYPAPTVNYRQEMEKATRERLETLIPEDERAQLHAQLVMRWGSPFVEVVKYAKSKKIDMIVMGSHGLGPIGHMMLGSVAERVVRKAPCPVLVVRHQAHEFVLP